jgi:hypothetical protein
MKRTAPPLTPPAAQPASPKADTRKGEPGSAERPAEQKPCTDCPYCDGLGWMKPFFEARTHPGMVFPEHIQFVQCRDCKGTGETQVDQPARKKRALTYEEVLAAACESFPELHLEIKDDGMALVAAGIESNADYRSVIKILEKRRSFYNRWRPSTQGMEATEPPASLKNIWHLGQHCNNLGRWAWYAVVRSTNTEAEGLYFAPWGFVSYRLGPDPSTVEGYDTQEEAVDYWRRTRGAGAYIYPVRIV